MKKSKVLVIVVTYNAMKWADRCFNSLKNSVEPLDVIIIDNGSNDGTREFIKSNYSNYNLIETEANLGFGGANNIGLKFAIDHDYDFVYLLNQDAWIFPETIERIIKVYEKDKSYGILSPMQFSGNEESLDPGFEKILNNCNQSHKKIIDSNFVMAAHWLIPKEALKKIGGFSPTFFQYGEDNNYVDRVHYFGLKIGICKDSKAVHDRYFRPTPKKKRLYQNKVTYLIRLSNPNLSVCKGLMINMLYSIAYSIKELSLIPIFDLYSVLRSFHNLSINRRKSIILRLPFIE